MKVKSSHPCFSVIAGGAFKFGGKARMNSKAVVWISLLLTLIFASTGYSLPINILDTQYTTTLTVTQNLPPSTSRTTTSTVPISDSQYDALSGALAVEASAGLFATYANTANLFFLDPEWFNSAASATSEVWFSPLISQTTTINIQFSGSDHWLEGSAESWSLLDVTSGNEVWNYGSPNPGLGPVPDWAPWVFTGDFTSPGSGTLAIDTDFNAGDIYELTMSVATYAGSVDPIAPSVSSQLTGLEPVPEPSTFALFGLALFALAMGLGTGRSKERCLWHAFYRPHQTWQSR